MTILLLGLLVFLCVHSTRIFADDWRSTQVKRFGAVDWKAIYGLLSLAGFGLILWGFGLARQQPVVLWVAPIGVRHGAALLTLIAFVLLVAAYVPRNALKARLHHPMLLGVKLWAFSHLLVNGKLADLVLFGAFLAWAVACFIAARKRDRAAGTEYPPGTPLGTGVVVIVGVMAWVGFVLWLHAALIGVRPLG
ncbi:MAG: NnrU family protein [Proteobacteria bacterium]|nr:NnrU family protein [Pseudomonadota bacterium]